MSLFDDIKDTAAGRELSIRWYQSRIGDLEGRYLTAPSLIDEGISEERVTSRPTYWMMNMFRYFPLKGERLPYWIYILWCYHYKGAVMVSLASIFIIYP